MKKTFKRILDILMTLALPCLMAYELIGQETHEILGLCMVGLFILHHAINWQWHRNLFRGKYTAYRAVLTVLDVLMIIVFIDQAVTGIMMAKHVFRICHMWADAPLRGCSICSAHTGASSSAACTPVCT